MKYEIKSPRCHELRLTTPPHDCLSFNFRSEQEAQEWATVVMSSLREAQRGQCGNLGHHLIYSLHPPHLHLSLLCPVHQYFFRNVQLRPFGHKHFCVYTSLSLILNYLSVANISQNSVEEVHQDVKSVEQQGLTELAPKGECTSNCSCRCSTRPQGIHVWSNLSFRLCATAISN